ncbi:bifunctional folylpolyglutamate synthase/dihydrofolate synthase [Haliscomenobacter hydrossis]|uniref:Dihydrofolate synthase/folylpolyglutamate synthase n=1 Tax=Haliscomenobacter hydrossis (strain ATCC 27775 / DSM 1100 / LMG 10767 / O) TaxID=760192 RepID=F4KPZ1_HALH1|nr:folylpolyglutamate synthase/dihydrofolate synthase family protein [Haliscomenobacter hydrossis]AEE53195.1 FolC bifunctional protein [Haliscomenobacter hydrossis DSM 1100]
MLYQQVLDYLYAQLPMYHRIGGAAFKKDLTNTHALLDFLGNPQQKFSTIHVGGTNGKGSTSHMLSAILQAKGLKTGLYVSPHYRDFRERIKVNGQYISRKYVIDFVEKMKPIIAEVQPSFFELTVAMAFDYFAKVKVEAAVIEVGLGGRLDSTNVIRPELSVITNISFDHMQFLGETLPEIASEKAGIIKTNVPVVIGETHPESAPVFLAKAQEEHAPIQFADQHYRAKLIGEDLYHTEFDVYQNEQLRYPALRCNLHGDYQVFNLQTVLQAVDCLPAAWGIDEKVIRTGLLDLKHLTRFMGRWQLLAQHPSIIADSAHNEAGLALAMNQLQKIPHRQLHLVIGVVKDKDLQKMIPLLPIDGIYYFAKPDIPRGLEATILQKAAAEQGRKGKAYTSVKNALKAARRKAQPEDVIYVGGSIFVLAEII